MVVLHNPWRDLLVNWPDWEVRFTRMPDGLFGCTDTDQQIIWLDDRLTQTERRCTLAHEMIHASRGDLECDEDDEDLIEQMAARLLLPLGRLLTVLPWANSVYEAADELWVDEDMLRCRLTHLHPSEVTKIRKAFARRDNTD